MVATACKTKNCGNVFLLKETSKIYELMERDKYICHSCGGNRWQKFFINETNDSADSELAKVSLLYCASNFLYSIGTLEAQEIDITALDDNEIKFELEKVG